MCGIFGYIGPRTNAAELVLEGLKSLEYRGYDSWGVGAVNSRPGLERIVVKKKAGKIGSANVSDMPKSTLALGHTRWATHGGVTDTNAHPHLDCTGTIAVVHNGIFENYDKIKKQLVKKGHRFISETDTEVIAHLIEEEVKRIPFPQTVRRVFKKMEGLSAFIAIKANERVLVAVRNGSPLVVGYGNGENFLASDPAAVLPYTKRVYFLEDNQMAVVNDSAVHIYDVKTSSEVRPSWQKLSWSPAQTEKGTFPFYMLKEIHEQPGLVAEIATKGTGVAQRLSRRIRAAFGSYLIGCGTADYACIAGSYLFSKIAKYHINWAVASEFGYHEDFLTKKSLVIALSQSGETMDIIESVKKAKARGATLAALVNVAGSTLYRLAEEKILLGAGPEKSVASTKAFTSMIAYLVLTAYTLAGKSKEGGAMLRAASRSAKRLLVPSMTKRLKTLAKHLTSVDHIYIIGRGLSYPASLEAALKIKEISYIHAEGFAAGELKHGVIALITKGTPCIVFAPNDETYSANLAGAMELKARGGRIIGISFKPSEVFDEYIPVSDAGEATIIPNVIVAQLLAYYLTIEKGLDPDKPRNLAKSVTVK